MCILLCKTPVKQATDRKRKSTDTTQLSISKLFKVVAGPSAPTMSAAYLKKRLPDILARYVCSDVQPFHCIDKPGFRQLILALAEGQIKEDDPPSGYQLKNAVQVSLNLYFFI